MAEQSVVQHLFQEELYSISPPVLIIIPIPWDAVSEEHKVLLNKILGSVKLSLPMVQIITLSTFSPAQLEALGSSRIIAFGARAEGNVNLYECSVVKGANVIVSDALDQLDDARKKSLWLALRQMFSI